MKSTLSLLVLVPLILLAGCTSPAGETAVALEASSRARLGMTTSVPGKDVENELGLENRVRVLGRHVDWIEADSPAGRAGLRTGDVLLRFGSNDLYSADDITDFLSVTTSGQTIAVAYKRADTQVRGATITLDDRPEVSADNRNLQWQFASLGQFSRALDSARAEKKKVMVGLSGSET